MRILIASHVFAPSIGGIEQVGAMLASEFAALGQEVNVVTPTPAAGEDQPAGYAIWRRPSRARLWALVRACDVYFQNNLSLATLWPALLQRRVTVVAHHIWLTQPDGTIGWRERLKRGCTRVVSRNVAVSRAMAAALPAPSTVIPNPYDEAVFFVEPTVSREQELVFVGRLVSDKGVDVLIEALARLEARALKPRLTIVGTGPEEPALKEQVRRAGCADRVRFAGVRTGSELRRELNAHEILVVPSRREEPFGIVALEGVACGCVVVGSSGGGLPEAIGPCGEVFPNGDAPALAQRLEQLLGEPERRAARRAGAAAHLAAHRRRPIAETYLEVFRAALKR